MSDTTTATVETLTAEVRTLVVGSRQVTLSVAKQLDVVTLENLTVMGRVSLKSEFPMVIGKATDGTLALAHYMHPYPPDDWHIRDLGDHIVTYGSKATRGSTSGLRTALFIHGRRALLPSKNARYDRDSEDSEGITCCCEAGLIVSRSFDDFTAQQAARAQRHRDAAASPLIVLAGLK